MHRQRILRSVAISIVLDNEGIVSSQIVRALDLVGISRRQHREERSSQLVIEPIQQLRDIFDGHIGRCSLRMSTGSPPAVTCRVVLGNLDRPRAFVTGQQRALANLNPWPVPPRGPRYGAKIFRLLGDVVGIKRAGYGTGIDAPVGGQGAGPVLGAMARNGRVGTAQHFVAWTGQVAKSEHLLGFGVVPKLYQHGAKFEPRTRRGW
mmetsp:Transcript_6380/g.14021  ORF Transcript_6380/g.14021 Transcript_6380/m.14021 type:complete len:206 (-) Transcript_6380:383-1000(-)